MKCLYCDSEIKENNDFCPYCRAKVEKNNVVTNLISDNNSNNYVDENHNKLFFKQNKKMGLILDVIALILLLLPFVLSKYSGSIKISMAFIFMLCWGLSIVLLIASLIFYSNSKIIKIISASIIYSIISVVGGILLLVFVLVFFLSSCLSGLGG